MTRPLAYWQRDHARPAERVPARRRRLPRWLRYLAMVALAILAAYALYEAKKPGPLPLLNFEIVKVERK